MDKKTIFGVLAGTLLLLVVLVWLGKPQTDRGDTTTNSSSPGALTAQEASFDFGTISMANGKVRHIFTISNPSASDVDIKNLETSCMCTEAYLVNGTSRKGPFGMPGMGGMTTLDDVIKAESTAQIEAEYDPAAHGPAGVGAIDRLITLTEAGGSQLQLEIKANVTP